MEEENRAKEYDRSVYHLQMQSEAKNNFDLKKEIEGLKKENEGLKKENEALKKKVEELQMGNESLMSAQNQNLLESSEPQIVLSSPRSQSIDTPPPLLEPPLTQTPTQQDISTERVRQYFRDRSPEISEPLIVSDSESDDENEVPDVQFAPTSSNQTKNEKAKRRAHTKAKERAKKLMDSVLSNPEPWKCAICSFTFSTSAALRQHVLANHKEQKHFCKRCPYTWKNAYPVKQHEQSHFRNDVNYKNKAEGRECKLCKIWFATNGHLYHHIHQYHLPRDS